MHFNPISLLAALFVVPACAKTCNRDNCFRALLQYQSQTDTAFCNQYLATPYDDFGLLVFAADACLKVPSRLLALSQPADPQDSRVLGKGFASFLNESTTLTRRITKLLLNYHNLEHIFEHNFEHNYLPAAG